MGRHRTQLRFGTNQAGAGAMFIKDNFMSNIFYLKKFPIA